MISPANLLFHIGLGWWIINDISNDILKNFILDGVILVCQLVDLFPYLLFYPFSLADWVDFCSGISFFEPAAWYIVIVQESSWLQGTFVDFLDFKFFDYFLILMPVGGLFINIYRLDLVQYLLNILFIYVQFLFLSYFLYNMKLLRS